MAAHPLPTFRRDVLADPAEPVEDESLFRLHFDDADRLEDAYETVGAEEAVVSCLIEPDPGHLFFVAEAGVGEALLEEIYAHGGLRWCSRHSVRTFY
jgi:hypothetical protein